jgi:hypothetical protein
MITLEDVRRQWGEANLVQLPVERYARILRVDPRTLSPEAALPVDVPVLFTAEVNGDVKLFDLVQIRIGDDQTIRLIVLGAAPGDTGLLYCLDAGGGSVVLVDLRTPSIEPVNSTMAAFVEFLLRLAGLISTADSRGASWIARVRRVQDELSTLDPAAFDDPESWWHVAFEQLRSR